MKNRPYPYYMWEQAGNIWALLELAAKNYGGRDAFVFKRGKQLCRKSFAELRGEAHALAAYFIKEGYVRDRIAILGENSYEWILAWFGIVLSGNIAVPVDKLLQAEHIAFILEDTQAAAVVYSKQYAEMVPGSIRGISMEKDLPACIKAWEGTSVPDNTDKEDLAAIIYTSGTTGIAKGVALTQANFCADVNSLTNIAYFPGHNLFVLPLNHVYAFTGMLLFMIEGVTTYISAGLKRVSQEMKEYGPSTMLMVPLFLETMYAKIMDSAKKQGKEKLLKTLMKVSLGLYNMGIDVRRKLFKTVLDEFGGNLDVVICGGAPLDTEYVRQFRAMGINVMNGYGITECSPCVTGNRNLHHRDGSVGQAVPGAEIKTNTPDGRSEGELYIRGPMVMKSYYNNEEATREAFDGDWFKSGDYGYIDEDGFIFITGRKKNIIILNNGKNLYPEELELQLMKIPAVKEVVVYEDERQVAAEIFPNADWMEENGVTDIRGYLHQEIDKFNGQLPAFKNITKIKLRDEEFPKTSSQKIRRNVN